MMAVMILFIHGSRFHPDPADVHEGGVERLFGRVPRPKPEVSPSPSSGGPAAAEEVCARVEGAGHCTSVGRGITFQWGGALHFSGVGHYILVGQGITFQWGGTLHFSGAGFTLEGGGALHLSWAGHCT